MLTNGWHRRFAKAMNRLWGEQRLLWFALNEDQNLDEGPVEGRDILKFPGTEDIERRRGRTRNATSDVMAMEEESDSAEAGDSEAKEEQQEFVEIVDIHARIEGSRAKLAELIANQNKIRRQIESNISDPNEQRMHMQEFQKIVGFSENAQRNLQEYSKISSTLVAYKRSQVSTEQFKRELESYVPGINLDYLDEEKIEGDLRAIEDQSINYTDEVTEKLSYMQHVFDTPELQEMIRAIQGDIATIEGSLSAAGTYAESLEEVDDRKRAEDDDNSLGAFFGNIEFISVMHIVRGGKKMIEAWQKSIEEWSDLKDAGIAQAMANKVDWLPWGEQATQVLDRETEAKNDEVMEGYKKGLANVPFSEIETRLEKSKYNPNQFRAILEHAADHAWLYGYDAINGTVFGYNITKLMPSTWNEERINQYLRELDNKNSAGQDSEKKRGYDRVSTLDSIPPLMKVFHDEMQRGNYWAIHGIIKRALEKGKQGETSTWLATSFMRYLRDDPVARSYVPKDLLDDIGNLSIASPAWMNTFWKLDRHTISDWQKTDQPVRNAGVLGSVIAEVEEDIKEKLGYLPKQDELDHLSAKILAGQTVEYAGKRFSIYDSRYRGFRHFLNTTPTSISAKDTDDDFYNVANGGSEVVLMGQQAYRAILELASTGEFQTPVKSMYFLEQLIAHSENNAQTYGISSVQYQTYMKEISSKMGNWLLTNANDSRSAEKLGNARFSKTGKLVFVELMKANVIKIDDLLRLRDTKNGLPSIVIKQLVRENAGYSSEILSTATRLQSGGYIDENQFDAIQKAVQSITGGGQQRRAA